MKRTLFLSLLIAGFISLINLKLMAYHLTPEEPLSANRMAWSQGNQKLTADFYRHAKGEDENFLFSPLSLQLCLAMAGALAYGGTQQEMVEGACLPQDDLQRRLGAEELLSHIDSPHTPKGEMPRFFLANSAWTASTMEVPKSVNELLVPYYRAEVHQRDFADSPDDVCKEINTWVEDQTIGKIKNLLPPGSINGQTSLVLINTLYFKAPWRSPFNPHLTDEGPFYGSGNSVQSVSYMHQSGVYPMADAVSYVAVELPFRGSTATLSLFIVMPKEGYALEDLEVTQEGLADWMGLLEWKAIDLSLPKFKVASSVNAKNVFQNMGMRRPFSPSEAEFVFAGPQGRVFISDIVHQAVFEIDEEGGTGAAATGVIMTTRCALEAKESVVINRPFFLFVADRTNGLILFAGTFCGVD